MTPELVSPGFWRGLVIAIVIEFGVAVLVLCVALSL
jgi:hypothetical protein